MISNDLKAGDVIWYSDVNYAGGKELRRTKIEKIGRTIIHTDSGKYDKEGIEYGNYSHRRLHSDQQKFHDDILASNLANKIADTIRYKRKLLSLEKLKEIADSLQISY